MKLLKTGFFILALTALLGLTSCPSGITPVSPAQDSTPSGSWIWTSGSFLVNQQAVFGQKNVANKDNTPGNRFGSVFWSDNSGNIFLFGGGGITSPRTENFFNDLWKYDGKSWTWIGGPKEPNQSGSYGIKGTANTSNWPGARYSSSYCIDKNGILWLFGGQGYDSRGGFDLLSDLWKFDGYSWTWVSGSDLGQQNGSYGTKGVADAGNWPASRMDATLNIDASGTLWLFGGNGLMNNYYGFLNDLCKFDGTNWTWVSGENVSINQIVDSGHWGTLGVADPSNTPSARYGACSAMINGKLFIFGGFGIDIEPNSAYLNDLWEFNGTNWIWVSGSNTGNQAGVFGQLGIADLGNVPASRRNSSLCCDASGRLYLFGGDSNTGLMNDFWRFDGEGWTWLSGSDLRNQSGKYSVDHYSTDCPGSRRYVASFMDSSGKFWMYGGTGYGATDDQGYLGDLWYYKP